MAIDDSATSNSTVLVVDLQYDFFKPRNGGLGSPEKAFCLPDVFRLLDYARGRRWRIVHVKSVHDDESTLLPVQRARELELYCRRGTEGADIVDGLARVGEPVVEKRAFTAFHQTDVVSHLPSHGQLIVAGVAADCCVLHTVLDAVTHTALRVLVPYQAVSATGVEAYLRGLQVLGKSAADVVNLDTLLAAAELAQLQRIPDDALQAPLEAWFTARKAAFEPIAEDYKAWVSRDGIRSAVTQLMARLV